MPSADLDEIGAITMPLGMTWLKGHKDTTGSVQNILGFRYQKIKPNGQ